MQRLREAAPSVALAMSNVVCVFPSEAASQGGDYEMGRYVIFVAVVSCVSHLVMKHKHGMRGIAVSIRTSRAWNIVNTIACCGLAVAIVVRFLRVCTWSDVAENKLTFLLYLVPFVFLWISESDKTPYTRVRYFVCHLIWHVSIYVVMNDLFRRFLYWY